ncbi:class I SAM-dependent methyltransferase [Shouchella sp. JSM 1781072]|uniref:class I SAM-dependent DNA methyltransferase n=1 Tax=Bacillaceae TaxID=186817 RepID=UPI000C0767D1|nr:class I SAM-dependent methyltransferase [Bacillus sp. Marseille-P3800]
MSSIFTTNFDKYANPDQYDHDYGDYKDDYLFLKEHIQALTGPIIDLACGTGRVTIPLAKAGYQLIGVDLHGGMLAHAKRKAETLKLPIHFYEQDCTQLDLNTCAPLIYMTGNSFQHFLTNESQDQLFQSVRKHLRPNGEFIFDTRNPILEELAEDFIEHVDYTDKEGNVLVETHSERYDALTQILSCTTEREGVKESIDLRYMYPQELLRLLTTQGFTIKAVHGSWKKQPFTAKSPQIIVHCQLTTEEKPV